MVTKKPMAQIDKIRSQCLSEMENHFAMQMSKLVDDLELENAESISTGNDDRGRGF